MKKRFSELYQHARGELLIRARTVLIRDISDADKRMQINSLVDHYAQAFKNTCPSHEISEEMATLGCQWLFRLAASLHPKSA